MESQPNKGSTMGNREKETSSERLARTYTHSLDELIKRIDDRLNTIPDTITAAINAHYIKCKDIGKTQQTLMPSKPMIWMIWIILALVAIIAGMVGAKFPMIKV
jgi:hypothetical protein